MELHLFTDESKRNNRNLRLLHLSSLFMLFCVTDGEIRNRRENGKKIIIIIIKSEKKKSPLAANCVFLSAQ